MLKYTYPLKQEDQHNQCKFCKLNIHIPPTSPRSQEMIDILSHNMLKTYLLSNFQYNEQHLKVKDLEMAYNLNQLQETNMMAKFLPTMIQEYSQAEEKS